MNILFVIPKQGSGKNFADRCFWSRGALQIATFLKNNIPDANIRIIDCTLLKSQDEIEDYLNNVDILGISVLSSFAYENGVNIAKTARKMGVKKIVMGGHHVSTLPLNVLKHQDSIDAVITGKGEIAFTQYVKGDNPETIKNLVWRKGKEIVVNDLDIAESNEHQLQLDNMPFLDYSLLPLEQYWQNHKINFPFLPQKVYITFTHEGCNWRARSKGCTFCDLMNKKRVYRDPKNIWNEVSKAVDNLGAEYVKDFGDCITGDKNWLIEFLQARPEKLQDIPFWTYARTSEVDEETALLMKELNIRCVYVGYESNSNRQLKNMRKGTTAKLNLRATKLFAKYNITIFAGYVLGSKGETEESLRETYDFAKEICDIADVKMSGASPLAVLPGSQDWFDLIKLEPKYQEMDILDFKQLELDWLKHFCKELGSPEEASSKILEYCNKINKLSPLTYLFGWDEDDLECGHEPILSSVLSSK